MSSKGFWSIWFRLGLYDRLMPINYDYSLREAFRSLEVTAGLHIGDFGCGSGRLLVHAIDWIKSGSRVTEIDIDNDGLDFGRVRVGRFVIESRVSFQQMDLTSKDNLLPLETFDGAVAHFSLYTMRTEAERHQALKQIFSSLKPGAHLVASVPSESYQIETIIADARRIESERTDIGVITRFLRKNLLYPVTKKAMRKIETKLDSGDFKRFSKLELKKELETAGFTVQKISTTYGGCGYHAFAFRS